MNARTESLAEPEVTDHFVCACVSAERVRWLAQSLVAAGAVDASPLDSRALSERIASVNPALVFVDFSDDRDAAALATASIRAAHPGLPIVALGSLAQPESALAALRAGVRDFVDVSGPAGEALRIARELLDHAAEPPSRHGKVAAVLGARAGMGVSTLVANLAVLLQKRAAASNRQTALIDLGLPAGDSTLFLNTRCEFHFVDAVRNLRRFDRTFVNTAFARHPSGIALTTLPPNLAELRDVSYASCVALVNRLRSFFDCQLIDLGGFSNREFIVQVARAADVVWLVCDQSVASVVSAVELLDSLREAGGAIEPMQLVVNQYDAELGLTPEQIALRLGIPLVATLPSRRVAIGHAANQGRLVAEAAERDPYVRALASLAARLQDGAAPDPAQASAGFAALRRFLHLPSKRS